MIALTRGQRRWRYQSRVRTALLALPTWIIFAGILFSGGKPIFKGGKLAMGTCADCCPGTTPVLTCADCPGGVCASCGGTDPTTPSAWHVTYLGVDVAMPCTNCGNYAGNFASNQYLTSAGSLGTYTLAQNPFENCEWFGDGYSATGNQGALATCWNGGAPTGRIGCPDAMLREGDSVTCAGGTGAFYDGDQSFLEKTAGLLTLTAITAEPTEVLGGTFFNGSIATDDTLQSCCRSYLIDNANVAYACPAAAVIGVRTGVYGINGSASVSVC